jgi:hypothetical protein
MRHWARPRSLDDDGADVTVDLHGCSVEEALYFVDRCLAAASSAGRQRLHVIHGLGGTDPLSSIRAALREAIARGQYDDLTVDAIELSGGGKTVFSLDSGGGRLTGRISINDILPPGR